MNDSIRYIKNVPNNADGQTFIRVLRQSLKGTPNGVFVRGRGPRKPHVGQGQSHDRLRQDLPLKLATHFTVYITEKPKFRYVRQTKTVTEWVKTPTKWASPTVKAQFKSGLSV